MTGRAPHNESGRGQKSKTLFSGTRRKALSFPTQFLVIDWASTKTIVSHYRQSNGELKRIDSFSIVTPDTEVSSATEIGKRISSELLKHNISAIDVVVSVPRRFVVLKDIKLPSAILSNDITEVVGLQCEKLFPVNLATLVIDHVVSPSPNNSDEITVLVAAIPKDFISKIADALNHAKLRVMAMGISDLGIARLPREAVKDEWQFHVMSTRARVDFLLVHNLFPVISFGSEILNESKDTVGMVCSAYDRILHAARLQNFSVQNPTIHLHGFEEESSHIELKRRFPNVINFHSAYAIDELRERALVASYKTSQGAFDFYNPRKPVDTVARDRRRSIAMAIAILFACCILSVPSLLNIRKLDERLAEYETNRRALQEQLDRVAPIEKSWKNIVAFEKSKLDIASEIRQIVDRLRPAEQMYLSNLEVQENPNSGATVVRIKGRVKDRETFSAITDDFLTASDKYRLQPPLLEPVTGDEHYRFSFTFEMELKT